MPTGDDESALIDDGLEILSDDECRELLRRHAVGRVAVTVAALPAIFPVNYAVLGGDIVFRTGEGTKFRAALAHTVVAFQIDDFDPARASGWSVMAVGVAHEVTNAEELAAVEQLDLHPFAGGDRIHYVKIRPEFFSGRRIAARPASV